MSEGAELEDVRDIAAKAVSQTTKLALVLHIANSPEVLDRAESVIAKETWDAAKSIGLYHLTEAVRGQRLAQEDKTLAMAVRILRWIRRRHVEEFKAGDVQQRVRPRVSANEAREAIAILIDYGYCRSDPGPPGGSPTYLVNPILDTLDVLDRGV